VCVGPWKYGYLKLKQAVSLIFKWKERGGGGGRRTRRNVVAVFIYKIYIWNNPLDVYPFISLAHVDIQTLPFKGTC